MWRRNGWHRWRRSASNMQFCVDRQLVDHITLERKFGTDAARSGWRTWNPNLPAYGGRARMIQKKRVTWIWAPHRDATLFPLKKMSRYGVVLWIVMGKRTMPWKNECSRQTRRWKRSKDGRPRQCYACSVSRDMKMKRGWCVIMDHAKWPGRYDTNGLTFSTRNNCRKCVACHGIIKKVYQWRSTGWWHCLQTRMMEEDPENRTRWQHKWGWHNRGNTWDKIATVWVWQRKLRWKQEERQVRWRISTKFVTFILSRMKFSTVHRKGKSKDIEKKMEG